MVPIGGKFSPESKAALDDLFVTQCAALDAAAVAYRDDSAEQKKAEVDAAQAVL